MELPGAPGVMTRTVRSGHDPANAEVCKWIAATATTIAITDRMLIILASWIGAAGNDLRIGTVSISG
jgi:hypothetical protein